MEFESAKNSKGKLISLEECKKSEDLEKLRGDLYCPTKDCKAQLSYVAARNPYFKTRNNSIHLDECPHKKENIEIEKRKNKRKQSVNLGENDVYSRLNRYMGDFFGNKSNKTNKSKSSTKRKQKSEPIDEDLDAKPQGIPSTDGRIGVGKDVISPRISKKLLNEFISSDQNGIFQVPAQLIEIKKINTKKYKLKIKDLQTNCSGEILLQDKYFSRNIQGINEQLDFLKDYLAKNPNNVIYIAYYGTLLDYKIRQFEVFVDYGFKLYLKEKSKPKKYTLAEFYSLYSR